MRIHSPLIVALLALFALSSGASAQQEPLSSQLEIFQVVQQPTPAGSREQLVEVQSTLPGTLLEYVLTYRNVSNQSLGGLDINSPVPVNTRYLEGSAYASRDALFQFSTDGGESWLEEGVEQTSVEQSADFPGLLAPPLYTHLRWQLQQPLPPGGELRIQYRVRVQ